MGHASVGAVLIGGPYSVAGSGEGHAKPPGDFRLRTAPCVGQSATAPRRFSRGSRASRIGGRLLHPTCRRCSSSSRTAEATAAASTPEFSSRSNGCSSIRIFFAAHASRATSARLVSPQRPRARVARVVLPVEQHSRRAAARRSGARATVQARGPRASTFGACWPIPRATRALVAGNPCARSG